MQTHRSTTAPAANPSARLFLAHQQTILPIAIYLLWTGLAWFAHFAGTAPLVEGTGWILTLGVFLSAALFHGLARLPEGRQPPAVTTIAAESLMAVVWTTLYAHFCEVHSWLVPGMYLTAVMLVVPAGGLGLLRRVAAVALLAYTLTLLMSYGVPASLPTAAGLMAVLTEVGTFAAMLLSVYLSARWFEHARAKLKRRNDELVHLLERTSRKAELDELTSSYNRGYIMGMLEREKARADRTGETFCVCLLDIDHFKAMNDQYGHLTGDRVLAGFARRVRGELRSMDSVNRHGRESSLGRVGGEEFLVALPHTSLRGALRCAERLRRAVVRRPFNGVHQVTVSIGIAEYRPGETIASLLGRADEALYGAKRGGRNRVHGAGPNGGKGNTVVMPDMSAAG